MHDVIDCRCSWHNLAQRELLSKILAARGERPVGMFLHSTPSTNAPEVYEALASETEEAAVAAPSPVSGQPPRNAGVHFDILAGIRGIQAE